MDRNQHESKRRIQFVAVKRAEARAPGRGVHVALAFDFKEFVLLGVYSWFQNS